MDVRYPNARPALPPTLEWRAEPSSNSWAPAGAARMTGRWETWRFLPDKRLNRYYPAGTWTIAATAKDAGGATVTEYASFQLKRDTRLSEVTVERAKGADGATVRLRGSLTRVDPRGLTDYGPFAGQPLEILWRPGNSATWERVGQAKTDAAGGFVSTIQAPAGGQWRVRYPGTGHYSSDISKTRQITQ
ncbi:hypothetical protein ITP53_53430 [Nonomuraea sp. K274]|uniref:Uncharacterized protein n=1 Tax=Nonomuraea cypriaca TaxID=1187855 RepID=A0A931APQ6_9ACTN|nr:hypothetical protein [Nonomuraea cypriaca]MBF8194324.1 hypothetical protein [Nonomuraea cypriaca]